jgi:hypothetical protein
LNIYFNSLIFKEEEDINSLTNTSKIQNCRV